MPVVPADALTVLTVGPVSMAGGSGGASRFCKVLGLLSDVRLMMIAVVHGRTYGDGCVALPVAFSRRTEARVQGPQ